MWTEVDTCRGRVGTEVYRCLLKYTLVLVCISFFNLGDINCHSLFVRFGMAFAIHYILQQTSIYTTDLHYHTPHINPKPLTAKISPSYR